MILALILALTPAHATTDVLMLGNSYTQQQDLPSRLQQVFEAAGHAPTVQGLTSGGLTLANHAEKAQDKTSSWYEALVTDADQREWVVLQDQSQIPGFQQSSSYWKDSMSGAETLNTIVAEAGAETMFFMTWGRRDGDSQNPTRYPDFSTMQEKLMDGYLSYVDATSAKDRPTWVAPVGLAFAHIYNGLVDQGEDPSATDSAFYTLYSSDGSHPSASGSYLAACVFYASITGESPVGLEAPNGFDSTLATFLQEAAEATVFTETDELDYPWEVSEPPKDTGTSGNDTGESVDTAPPSGSDTGSVADTGTKPEADQGCGCSAAPLSGGVWASVFVLGALINRRRVE